MYPFSNRGYGMKAGDFPGLLVEII